MKIYYVQPIINYNEEKNEKIITRPCNGHSIMCHKFEAANRYLPNTTSFKPV
jgi:hypothetical protein